MSGSTTDKCHQAPLKIEVVWALFKAQWLLDREIYFYITKTTSVMQRLRVREVRSICSTSLDLFTNR